VPTVETAHSQQQREQILSTHRRHGRRCAGCGQSWPCAEVASVQPRRRPAWLRVAALAAAVFLLVAALVGLVVGLGAILVAGASS
jgi:hypothetical protein